MTKTPFTRERHHPFCQTSFPSLIRVTAWPQPPTPTRTTAEQLLRVEEDFARRIRFCEKEISQEEERRFREKKKEDFARRRFREKEILQERNFVRRSWRLESIEWWFNSVELSIKRDSGHRIIFESSRSRVLARSPTTYFLTACVRARA